MSGTFDAIVIGAGSVGTPLSYELSAAGLKTLVIEALASPGQGQNKAAIGGVRATHSDPAKILICKQSLGILSAWEKRFGYDIGWKPGGYCFPVYTEKIEATLKGILPTQKSYGLDIDWVGPDDIARIVPGVNPDGLRGGTYSPGDGQVSPLRAVNAHEREARKLGAVFRYKEPVTSIRVARGKVVGVDTTAGRYDAALVVIAAGASARRVASFAGVDAPVTPDSHEAGITAPVEHFFAPLVVDLRPGPEGRTVNFYFGQNKEGQIIFCYTPKDLFIGEDRESLSEFLPIISRRLVGLIPRLRHVLVRRVWRGSYPMTPDGIPIADRAPGVDGLYLGVGMCGQGFMLGAGMAKNLASFITTGKPVIAEDVWKLLRADRNFGASKKEALK